MGVALHRGDRTSQDVRLVLTGWDVSCYWHEQYLSTYIPLFNPYTSDYTASTLDAGHTISSDTRSCDYGWFC